jgi:hypothetical protein
MVSVDFGKVRSVEERVKSYRGLLTNDELKKIAKITSRYYVPSKKFPLKYGLNELDYWFFEEFSIQIGEALVRLNVDPNDENNFYMLFHNFIEYTFQFTELLRRFVGKTVDNSLIGMFAAKEMYCITDKYTIQDFLSEIEVYKVSPMNLLYPKNIANGTLFEESPINGLHSDQKITALEFVNNALSYINDVIGKFDDNTLTNYWVLILDLLKPGSVMFDKKCYMPRQVTLEYFLHNLSKCVVLTES